jgi:hypothetical protein
MNNFVLGIAVRAAKEWAKDDHISFGRFFDFSQSDRQWLIDSSEESLERLCILPTSPFQLNFTTIKTCAKAGLTVPSASIGTLTLVLSAITDDLRYDIRIGMITWGITDITKAEWLSKTTVQDRLSLAMSGEMTMSLRTNFRKMNLDTTDPTSQMATLMRILSGSSKS